MNLNNQKRIMWQKPFGYSESITLIGGVVVIGMLLQLIVGQFDFYLLAYPMNIYVGLLILALSVLLGSFAHCSHLIKWLSGVQVSVCLISVFLLLTIVMGFTVQVEQSQTLLGFDAMTRNWIFVLIYLITLLSLGTLIVKRLKAFQWRSCAFYLNHIGLWLFLAASGLGYADSERYIMHVQEGQTEWRVYNDDKEIKELPIAILLNDFDMDVFPPKLAIIDRTTGDIQPSGNPEYFQIDEDIPHGNLNGWTIQLKEYIHQAVRNSDSTYHEISMPGATPAVKVSLTQGSDTIEGWICAGNKAQLYMTLPLDSKYNLVMTSAEPRAFTSDIEVYTQTGDQYKTILKVNSPLRVGSWTIYQYGYDNNAGKLSSYSSFELVYDPWMNLVYISIFMLMAGMILMIFTGKNKKEVNNDVE